MISKKRGRPQKHEIRKRKRTGDIDLRQSPTKNKLRTSQEGATKQVGSTVIGESSTSPKRYRPKTTNNRVRQNEKALNSADKAFIARSMYLDLSREQAVPLCRGKRSALRGTEHRNNEEQLSSLSYSINVGTRNHLPSKSSLRSKRREDVNASSTDKQNSIPTANRYHLPSKSSLRSTKEPTTGASGEKQLELISSEKGNYQKRTSTRKIAIKHEYSISAPKETTSKVIDQECLIIFKNNAEVIPHIDRNELLGVYPAELSQTRNARNALQSEERVREGEELVKQFAPIVLRHGWSYDGSSQLYSIPTADSNISNLKISAKTFLYTLRKAVFYIPSPSDLKLCLRHNTYFQEEMQALALQESVLCNVLIQRHIDTPSSVRYSCSSMEGFEELIDGYDEVTELDVILNDTVEDQNTEIEEFLSNEVSILFTENDHIGDIDSIGNSIDAMDTTTMNDVSNNASVGKTSQLTTPDNSLQILEKDNETEELPRLRRSNRSTVTLPTKFQNDFVSDVSSESENESTTSDASIIQTDTHDGNTSDDDDEDFINGVDEGLTDEEESNYMINADENF